MIPTLQLGGLGLMRLGASLSPSTFPTISSVTSTAGWDTAVSSKDLTMSGTVNPGDLLIWIGGISCQSGTPTITAPLGWTELVNNGTTRKLYAAYKVADGSEGGTPQALSFSAVCRGVGYCYRIAAGTYTGNPEGTSTAPAAGTAPCPSLSPSWGSVDMLAIACCTGTTGTTTVSAYPLTDTQAFASSGLNSSMIAARCSGQKSVSPVSPGSFTLSVYNTVRTGTIAVRGT